METCGALLPAPSPSCACATPYGDAAVAPTPHVFFVMCNTELSFQVTLVCGSEEQI